MNKKVLILSGSPRKGGNSDLLCDAFMKGALEAGNEVKKIFVRDQKIAPCNACGYCMAHGGVCVLQDDMADILEKMHWADVIVLSSPVYFYSIAAQMKMVIDRTFAQWTQLKDKELYYIMTAAEGSRDAMACTLECFRGFAVCLDDAVEKGVLYGTGVYEAGEVKATSYMQEAYEMGKTV